jgi:fructose-1,6-bisphosphatase II
VARQKNKAIRDLVVFIIDRPRHQNLIRDIRKAGARVFLRSSGDVGGSLLAADPDTPVDLLMGIGGAAEALISACAVKALGGAMLAQVAPQSKDEKEALLDEEQDMNRIFMCDDLVKGDQIYFSATGVTDGVLLDGVSYHGETVETHTLALRMETGTRRIIHAEHKTG